MEDFLSEQRKLQQVDPDDLCRNLIRELTRTAVDIVVYKQVAEGIKTNISIASNGFIHEIVDNAVDESEENGKIV